MNRRALGWTWPVVVAVLATAALACNVGGSAGEGTATNSVTDSASATTAPSRTEQAARLVGAYFCSGHEGGTLAAAATLTLHSDGRVVEVPAPGLGGEPRTGTWVYEPATGELTFNGELQFASGEYSPGSGRILIRLEQAVERPHAEEGVLYCEPQ